MFICDISACPLHLVRFLFFLIYLHGSTQVQDHKHIQSLCSFTLDADWVAFDLHEHVSEFATFNEWVWGFFSVCRQTLQTVSSFELLTAAQICIWTSIYSTTKLTFNLCFAKCRIQMCHRVISRVMLIFSFCEQEWCITLQEVLDCKYIIAS